MQSSPPTRDGKARTLRELSRSLSHSPRQIPSPSPPPSDSNPTKRSGFDTATSNFFNDPDVLMSTQHRIDDDTNVLPHYPRIRSTAKKVNAWHMLRSEQPIPDTSMVDKEFRDFDDQSLSADDDVSIEQARGVNRSTHDTPIRASSQFNSLYDITPPSNRTRKSHAPETGSLRRDAQIRRASRNDLDTASPRPASKRNSPAVAEHQERRHTSLAQFHAKLSEDESSFMDQRPPTLTIDLAKNTRWGNRSRQTSRQGDQTTENMPNVQSKSFSRPGTAHNATAQSFILPDLPNLTELVSGVFEDGTPVISKSAPARSRFAAPPGGARRPQHIPIEGVPIPEEEKVIFAALQQLQDKVAQMEQERAVAEKTIEDQDMELIELRATNRAQEKLRRSDSALDSETGTAGWKIEKTRLDATVQTLRTKLDRTERKVAVLEIEKKRLTTERDNMAKQLSVAFQTCEELKREKNSTRHEMDILHTENETLRNKLDHERSLHQEETVQLQRQFDQAAGATEKENMTLHAELARKETELLTARQAEAEFDRLKRDHEQLKSQLASLKARREEDIKNWARQEAALKAQAGHRDETIQHVSRMSQQDTNEAMRQDIDNLRNELSVLSRKHQDEHQQWIRKEADMKRRIRHRETTDAPGVFGNDEQHSAPEEFASNDKFSSANGTGQRRSSYRRDDTRSRIQSRVQQEVHDSRAMPRVSSMNRYEEGSQKSSDPIARSSMYGSHAPRSQRNFSAPIATSKTVEVESEIESTTDLSLAPRSSQHASQIPASDKAFTAIPHPAELDLTELSYIDGAQIARLRRALEEERIAARNRPLPGTPESQQREETAHSQRPITREDTSRSVVSMRSSGRAIPRKSSLKDNTQRTNVTQFEEDATGNTSNFDAADDATQDKQVAGDMSRLSNTGRRRRSAPTEMTSAFIVPDIKLENRKETAAAANLTHTALVKDHDNSNCTVCRREGLSKATEDLRVPKLIPVSSRMPDDVDATLRPARSPREALALVVKELKDERAHLHMELAVMRAMLESHDVSLGNRKRNEINASIRDILRRLDIKDTQIYNLYDVLEGQHDAELTELDVENITEQIRAEEEKGPKESAKKGKKVTIRSFVDDDSVEIGRGTSVNLEDDTEELPWEGFADSGLDGDAVQGISAGWSVNLH